MIIQTIVFYIFSTILLVSAVMVVSSRNPVHSVLFLIAAFFNAAGLFVLMGAEFLAMILVIVYVGAVAVLFLFVVMMLDINFVALRQGFLKYLPVGLLVGLVLVVELVMIIGTWSLVPDKGGLLASGTAIPTDKTNAEALGALIYTRYAYLFQGAGMVLLVAMIGAIVLTLRARPGVRRQNIADQVARRPEETIEIKKVPSRTGV